MPEEKRIWEMVSGPLRKNRVGRANRCHELSPGYAGNDGCHADVFGHHFACHGYIFCAAILSAFHSDRLGETDRAGRTGGIQEGGIQAGEGTRLYNLLQKAAEDTCGLCLGKRNYCCGISDLSYCGGPDREEMASYAVNAPLWGTMYRMDLDAMADFRSPPFYSAPLARMRTRCRSGFTPEVCWKRFQ